MPYEETMRYLRVPIEWIPLLKAAAKNEGFAKWTDWARNTIKRAAEGAQ